MRDIKFRIWDKKRKKMLGPFDISEIAQGMHGVDDVVWLQYIGLKDKNGKEIYEGDILQYKDKGNITNDFIEAVEWNEDRGSFCTNSSEHVWGEVARSSKVIGNIHENPELLEVTKQP